MSEQSINDVMVIIFIDLFAITFFLGALYYGINFSKKVKEKLEMATYISLIVWFNSFLLWALFLSINNSEHILTFLIIGLMALCNSGFYAEIKGFSAVVVGRNLSKLIIPISIISASYLLFEAGALALSFYENSGVSMKGVVFGIIAGFFAAFVGYKQEYPKWVALGFSRARTPEEKVKINKMRLKQLPEIDALAQKYSFLGSYGFYIVIFLLILFLFGKDVRDNSQWFILSACVAFPFALYGFYFLFAILSDKEIRSKTNKNN